jgi:hypothetical protein
MHTRYTRTILARHRKRHGATWPTTADLDERDGGEEGQAWHPDRFV